MPKKNAKSVSPARPSQAARPSRRAPSAPAVRNGAVAAEPYEVRRTRLRNGLRLCTVEVPYLHTATVALYVRTGSRYETPEKNGLSHFLEHMLFRGSHRYPSSLALNTVIEELGGTLYAETGRDYAVYSISLGPAGVLDALAILGDLFSGPVFKDIELERQMVLEEILEDMDHRGRMVNVHDLSRQLAWDKHPLGYSILGTPKNVRRFSTRDVRTHFRRHYGASNMVLCVAGQVEHARVEPAARKAFTRIDRGTAIKGKPARPALAGPRWQTVATDAAQSQIQMLFFGLPMDDPDHAAQAALMRLIDDGMATPLHYRICDQNGLAYSVGAEVDHYYDTSLIEFDAACAPGKLSALVQELVNIIDEFKTKPVEPGALARVKRRYREDLEASYDDVGSLCNWYGGAELFARPRTHADRLRQMEKVTAEQVRRVAQRVFQAERLTTVVAGRWNATQTRKTRQLLRGL
ncbi:MAG: insulinase family protein [Myxococcales bacterium]|nr:insulinase family protein [Myxococcales bacterium]